MEKRYMIMNLKEISELICELDWNNPLEVQENAVKILSDRNDYPIHLLLQPSDKKYWENSAKVLYHKGYEEVKSITIELFYWLQDMNWPGSVIIRDLLWSYPSQILADYLEQILLNAVASNDEEWIYNLCYFIDNKVGIKDFTNKSIYKIYHMYKSEYENL